MTTPDPGATMTAEVPLSHSSRALNREPVVRKKPSQLGEIIFANLTRSFAFLALASLAGIIVSLVYGAWPSITKFGLPFLWTSDWTPPMAKFGALIPIYGTLVTSLIALVIAVPVSFGIAIFLTELSPPWLRRPLGTAIELLAAIPSIVYGMWGLLVFAPIFGQYIQPALMATIGQVPLIGKLFSGPTLGVGLLSAGIILSIMIIPFIASVMRDVFEITPAILRESAYGLGCTTWEVVRRVVLPYTQKGVIGGVMLGLGRALGETMAVTFVIGNANRMPASLFSPGTSIASVLANEFGEAEGLHFSTLFALGFLLFVITFVVLAAAKAMINRAEKAKGS